MLDRKIRYCSLPEAVRDHFLWGARSVVIAGTHGKTTTTSLAGWVLTHGGADPSVFVGGIAENFDSSYRVGGGREFVIEGDEYDSAFFDKTAKFLKYLPDIAVVNNIEFDHADIYPDLDAIRLAFQRFVNLVPRPRPAAARRRQPGGAGAAGAARAAASRRSGCRERRRLAGATTCGRRLPRRTFGVRRRRRVDRAPSSCRCSAPTTCAMRWRRSPSGAAAGLHSDTMARGAAHASAASGAGWNCAAPPRASRSTTTSPTIRRRLPRRSTASARPFPDRRIWAIFEPRSATSCRRIFQEEFATALAKADHVILPAVFRSTLPEDERLSPEQLVADLRQRQVDARYIPEIDDIVTDGSQGRHGSATW